MNKLFRFLKPYSLPLFITIFLLFLQSISNLFLPKLLSNIVDIGIITGDISYILQIGVLMLFVAFLGGVFAILSSLVASKVSMGFARDLRNSVFTKVESFSLGEFNKIGTASLITRTTNDITQLQMFVLMVLRMMAMAPLMLIGSLVLAFGTDYTLSIILLCCMPIIIATIALIGKKSIPLSTSMQKRLDRVNLVFRENLTGVRVIRAFNRINSEAIRFDNANQDYTNTTIKLNKLMALLMPAMMIIFNLTSVIILWFGAQNVSVGTLEVGSLIAFLQYVMQTMMALVMLSFMFVMIPRAQASAKRINEVLDLDFEIIPPDTPCTSSPEKGTLEFKDVSFFYKGGEEPALSNISFKAKPGKVTAIIGGTGSGKSTLVNMITRFYDTSSGEVLVDDVNVKDYTTHTLREKIGVVPQKAILFSGSIKDNILFGKEDASDEEILHALDIAQATDFVSEMDEGINSHISQGGTNVSGGQKQRLSIARALVRKPEIYIFDDSFSALDFKTDAKLRAALHTETRNAAVIIVAQRISTIMDADNILVLDDGKIVGSGTHKQLLDTCSIYKEIALSQLSKEEI